MMRRRSTISGPLLPTEVVVQFVRPDGTYEVGGVRVRCAPGVGVGSLREEMARGVATPIAPDSRCELRDCFYDQPDVAAFVDTLPEAVAAEE